jgi:hypothetical protein
MVLCLDGMEEKGTGMLCFTIKLEGRFYSVYSHRSHRGLTAFEEMLTSAIMFEFCSNDIIVVRL